MGILSKFFGAKKQNNVKSIEELVKNLAINELAINDLKLIVKKINDGMIYYKEVEMATTVPAVLIGCLHYREASFNFKTCLHNGELLSDVNQYGTRLVPKGRGKGLNWSWVQAAVDALLLEKNKFPQVWNEITCVEFAEKFNGLGYRNHGLISPYCFAGSNCYKSGMYTSDNKLDLNKVDKRYGVAPIMAMWRRSVI